MIQQVHRKLGQWSVPLVPDAPPGAIAALEYFGHVAIIPGRFNPLEHGDELLTLARYVGILRAVDAEANMTLAGVGMAAWLGDEDGKGDVFETPGVTLTAATFPNTMRALLPPGGAITEGTFYTGVAGTYTNTHAYQTPRAAIDYACDLMGGEWRVNGDGTLDTGPAASLFRLTPTCVIVRKGAGYDIDLKALPGDLQSTRDAKEYTSRVVLIAAALAGGTADAGVIPYKNIHGGPVAITRVIDEQDDTLVANAVARAQAALAKVNGIRNSIRLSADEFDIAGDFAPGDAVWVFDPDAGIYDTANEVPFRGRILQPASVRVLSVTWPVERGYTVAYRSGAGVWTDLTPWVDWESPGGGQIEVADSSSTALTAGVGAIGTQVSGGGGGMGDTAIPDVPVFGTPTSTSYQPGDGLARAAINLTWTQPLNTDASTIVDGDHYEIRYRPTGTSDWQITVVAFDQTHATIVDLAPSTGYDFQIRAVDYASPINYGAWSGTTAFTTSDDTTAPATPAAPAVAASLIAVQVTHTLGLAAGGTYNLPLDLDHLRIHVGTSSGFTTSAANLVGKLPANAAMISGGIPAVGTFAVDTLVTAGATAYAKVVAVDRTGNESTSSAAASTTAQLIDDSHIGTLTASKITAGSMTAAVVIGGSATFSGALSAATGTFAGSLSAATGTFAGSLSAATGTFAGSLSAATGTFAGTLSAASGSFGTVTGGTFQTASSSSRVVISSSAANRIDFYNSSGGHGYVEANTSGTNFIGMYSNSGNEYVAAYNNTCSINTSAGVVSANSTGWTAQATGGSQASITATSGTLTVTAATTLTLGGGGFGETLNVGDSSSACSLRATTINLSNITGTAASTSLTMVGRVLHFVSSTRKAKVGIRDLGDVPAADVLSLRPVSYVDRVQAEAAGSTDGLKRHLGMIAEEVAEVPSIAPYLVVRDDDDEPMSLIYERLPVLHQVVLADHERRLADALARIAALEVAG